jgi:hypothetical protein
MKAKQKSYKTRTGAEQNAAPGTVPLELTSHEQALELGFPVSMVGRWVLVTAPAVEDLPVEQEVDIRAALDAAVEVAESDPAPVAQEEAETPSPSQLMKGTRVQKSEVKSPVKVVHDFVAANPNMARKDQMKALQDMGVAFYTARTQIQIARKKLVGQQGVGSAVAGASPLSTEADGTVVIDGAPLVRG